MIDADAYLTSCRRVFEGIREDVDNDFVEISSVNPDRQDIVLVLIAELDVLGLGLLGKQGVNVADKTDKVRFAHVHRHLSLVNLSQVHHLVDKSKNTLCITADCLVDTASVWVVVLFDERQQRRDNERHRRAYLVRYVHEEA